MAPSASIRPSKREGIGIATNFRWIESAPATHAPWSEVRCLRWFAGRARNQKYEICRTHEMEHIGAQLFSVKYSRRTSSTVYSANGFAGYHIYRTPEMEELRSQRGLQTNSFIRLRKF